MSRPGPAVVMACLRKRPVAIALLMAFALLIGLVNQRLCASLDEAGQQADSGQSPAYIVTHFHVAQNHPLYGLLAHAAIRLAPRSPIRPVRLPAFLAGLLIPLAFYAAERRRSGHGAALLVATLLLLTDPIRQYTAVGRGYSLMLLGVLVLNALLLSSLRRGGWWRVFAYAAVGAATCYTHLWTFPVLGAHGLFLVMEAIRNRARGVIARRAVGMMAAVAGAGVIAAGLYLPMMAEIRGATGAREASPMIRPLVDALLQFPRLGSWTVAANLLIVPIVLEGCARRRCRSYLDRAGRLHAAVILVVLAGAMVLHPINFGNRFLMGIVPSGAALVASGLAGYWRGRKTGTFPALPRPATWAVGLALGILAANAPIAHEIPVGAVTGTDGRDSGYYYRDLPKRIGDPAALALLAVGVAGLRFGRGRRVWGTAGAWLLTGLLAASIPWVVLGPSFSQPLFEVHMLAVAAVLLSAWEHRFEDRYLHALRYAFAAVAALAVAWQAGIAMPEFAPILLLGLAAHVPPILLVIPLARTTGPAMAGDR